MSRELDEILRQALSEVSNSGEKKKQYPELADLLRSTTRRIEAPQADGQAIKLDEEGRERLCVVGEQILYALEAVAQAAQAELSGKSHNASEISLLGDSNPMVEGRRAMQKLHAIRAEVRTHLDRILREPFVARVVIEWMDAEPKSETTLYISRASVAGMSGAVAGAQLATYAAPLGRLAEFEAGDYTTIVVDQHKREARILERVLVRPERREGEWDALDDSFEFLNWRAVLDSVCGFLEELGRREAKSVEEPDVLGPLLRAAATLELVRQRARRKVVERIALRDQPILDRYQGQVFRMPLDRQLVLFGAPGTGKTTTLIRRLAQKRTPGALTQDEEDRLSGDLREAFLRPDSWVMFSPTELLKLYLRDSFNREGVPAADARNLRTWEKERLDLGRNVLGILRSGDSRGFQLDEQLTVLADTSSPGLSRLYDEVAVEVDAIVLRECNDAVIMLGNSRDESILAAVNQLRRGLGTDGELSIRELRGLLDRTLDLQPELKRLEAEIGEELRRIVNRLLVHNSNLIEEVARELPHLLTEGVEEEEDDADEELTEERAAAKAISDRRAQAARILMSAVRARARAGAEGRPRIGGVSGRLVEFLGDRIPTNQELAGVGERIATLRQLRTVARAPRELVLGAPRIYARFRRHAIKEKSLFGPEAANIVEKRLISTDEVDILELVMLRNARHLLEGGRGERIGSPTNFDWLESIKSRYLMQVFIDEATDFSAVQLACMLELSHPSVRSWFACGDLRQRVTRNGLKDRSELDWLNSITGTTIEVKEVNIGYRQSRLLRELAGALAALDEEPESVSEAPTGVEEAEVWPLLGETLSGDFLAAWLADRISEVELAIGRLPSIAVFVDGDEYIDSIVERTKPLLASRNIKIVACKEGRVVGDAQEIRVFDIHHIKGLEFEAVFFLGIDRLAEHMPELFHRFMYVGVTRAATYLGVTCESALPRRLETVRHHFATGGWGD